MKKKVDSRVRTLLENGVKTGHRTMFLIVGDHGKDQVVNLHYILSKASVKTRPSVLWCYKNELGFSSHRKKRVKQIKKMQQRGLLDPEKDDPFELFVASTKIRYCYYKETHKILGNTYGMCVLQDFEALTPNIMARTIETVEGGGSIVFLLKTMSSLKQLYTMAMDVHSRFRTEAHQDVVARFNERFILSLASCCNCLAMDDELNILPITSSIQMIQPVHRENTNPDGSAYLTPEQVELAELKKSLQDTQPVGALVETAWTIDQAKAVLTFTEAISEKTLRSTVTLTAALGRGKSASLGIAIASAVAYGYSNIFVTSPSPENLNTLFDFVFKGFDALQYKRHMDYEAIESTNPDFNGAIIRVNIFRDHRQTIQYIMPQDHAKLAQAELVVIDEAAAIPLPLVKQLLGPYLVFMSSTVNGYEGTGRSLSLKLIQSLRTQSVNNASGSARTLREVTLEEPIRYTKGDPVESWLNQLLCLDASTTSITETLSSHITQYTSTHAPTLTVSQASETFLSKMMALYVASHYRNTPNDLQLMSDAPAHQLFVLLGPVEKDSKGIPDILCVLQVCFEGEISKESARRQLARGQRASGDLIPWTLAQQYLDNEFAHLSGARIVRIATHPDMTRMGYGSRAIELLTKYFEGEICSLSSAPDTTVEPTRESKDGHKGLTQEELAPRTSVKQLLTRLEDRPPERLHWLGVSYGVTQQLYGFWKRAGFTPLYLRQTCNELTGEHTCIMLHSMHTEQVDASWLKHLYSDFQRRWMMLLGYEFRSFPVALALEILNSPIDGAIFTQPPHSRRASGHVTETTERPPISDEELSFSFTPYDLKRLESYANNLVDYHMIIDLVPELARVYFEKKTPSVNLSHAQAAILCLLGLQRQTMEKRSGELAQLKDNQFLALFNKAVRKMSEYFRTRAEERVSSQMAAKRSGSRIIERDSLGDLDSELHEGVVEVSAELREKQEKMIQELDLAKYSIDGDDDAWKDAINKDAKHAVPGSISIKSKTGSKKHKRSGSEQGAMRENSEKKKKKKKKDKQ